MNYQQTLRDIHFALEKGMDADFIKHLFQKALRLRKQALVALLLLATVVGAQAKGGSSGHVGHVALFHAKAEKILTVRVEKAKSVVTSYESDLHKYDANMTSKRRKHAFAIFGASFFN